jgi:hypothetical protein
MLNRLAPLTALFLLPFVLPLIAARPASGAPLETTVDLERPIASFFPERSLVYLEGTGLAPILEQGTEHPFVRRVLDSGVGALLESETGANAEAYVALADAFIGLPVLDSLAALSRNGAGFALTIDPERAGEEPGMLLVLRGDDPDLLDRALHRVFDLVEEKIGLPGALDRPAERFAGADVWKLGEGLLVGRRGSLLVVGNEHGFAREALELADAEDGHGLSARPDFAAPASARSGEETLWAWVDLERWAELEPEKLGDLRGMEAHPGVQALLGPGISALGSSRAASAWLSLRDGALGAGLLGLGASPVDSLAPGGARAPAPIPDRGDVAAGVLYRDYASFVDDRVELFPAEMLPGFAQALSTFSLFFGGADVGEEILPGLSPWVRVVAHELEYEEGRVPEITLPGLALVVELEDPERLSDEFYTAFQTLIGISNVDRAQKGGEQIRLHLGLEGDVEITSARFLAPGPEDGVDIKYNLQPACAVVDGSLVLGTHEELVRDVVRRLAARDAERTDTEGTVEWLSLSGRELHRMLEENFETLVMSKVLDEGVTYEEAEEELGGLKLLLSLVGPIHLEVDYGPAVGAEDALRFATLIELAGSEGSVR